jgi:hypothetical protein
MEIMLKDISGFLCWFGVPILITILVFVLLCWAWNKKTQKLRADTIMNPINTAITVASFIVPLQVAAIAYIVVTLEIVEGTTLTIIASSTLLFAVSVFVGLWNNFSLVTISDDSGTVEIKPGRSSYFPAQIVSQFTLVVLGLFLLLFIDTTEFLQKSPEVPKADDRKVILLSRPEVTHDTAVLELLSLWGKPDVKIEKDSATIFIYHADKSRYEIKTKRNRILEINHIIK